MALSRLSSDVADEAHEVVARPAIFFDRDGVLVVPNVHHGRAFAVTRVEDFRLYSEAPEALKLSHGAGFLNVVVTNQPDVASGKTSWSAVEAMHEILRQRTVIDRVEVSDDPSGSDAPRRKPNPGMLLDAAEVLKIDLNRSFMIGDRASDIEAGRRAGCKTVFIDRKYANDIVPEMFDYSAESVLDAVLWCMRRSRATPNA